MWGERTNAYRVLVGKSEGRRLLGRPGRKCDDNKKNLKEIEWKYMLHSSGSGYVRVAGSCEHNNEISGSLKLTEKSY